MFLDAEPVHRSAGDQERVGMRNQTVFLLAVSGLAALWSGCSDKSTTSPLVKSVQELEALEFPWVVATRDGGFSAQFKGRSVWVFGDTALRDCGLGPAWRSSTWSAVDDDDASDGIGPFEDPLEADGCPGEFLPFNESEQAFNDVHFIDCAACAPECPEDCGARFALWPGPMVVRPDTGEALILYSKISARPGPWNFEALGVGLARWGATSLPVERPEVDSDLDDPSLLFGPEEPPFVSAALIHEGQLYAYACSVDWLNAPCKLARVELDHAFKRAAWSYYAGGGGWTQILDEAVTVVDGNPSMTVHWSGHLGAWVAIHSGIVSADVMIHTAPHPEGPWSDARVLFTGDPTDADEAWNYGGVAHPEFQEDDGRVEYVTYYRPGEDFDGEMRLVRVEFH